MRIFITGVAGFLGSHLADRMIEKKIEVVGVDNLSGGFIENVNTDVEFHIADCMDIDKMKKYSKGCDVIFHAACTAHDGLSIFSPHYITQNTFQITMSVLSAALDNHVKRFIYCSSMARYGNKAETLYTEDMVCCPESPYGYAKLAAEKIIAQLASLNDMEYVIVVPHNIFGPRQNYTDPYRNVVAIMINRILQGKPPIIYGDGQQTRCFSYITDVIDCLVKIIELKNLNGEIINIGPDEEFITINRLSEMISSIAGVYYEPIYMPARPLEVHHAACSSNKARKLLGYKTKTTLIAALKEIYDFIRCCGMKEFNYNTAPIEIHNRKLPPAWGKKLI